MAISTIHNVKFVSSGTQGRVYRDLKSGHILKYAIKVDGVDDQSIEEEATLQTIAAMYGLAPQVINWNDDQLVIEMEYLSKRLIDEIDSAVWWYNEYKDSQPLGELFWKCGFALGKLHSLGILHADTHPWNWMMKVDPMLIDYGMAVENTDEVYFSLEFRECLYGHPDRGKAYVGLLGVIGLTAEPHLESCFTQGYCEGRGFGS